jgi:hypothetical protein
MPTTAPPVPSEVHSPSASLRPGWSWWLLAVLASATGAYAMALQDARRARDTVPGFPWCDEVHFFTGGLALAVGIWCFRRDVLVRHTKWHRRLGQLYMAATLLSGVTALAMAVYSSGGITAHLGFATLAVAWLASTLLGWHRIHRRRIAAHRRCMVHSYALCCAAITLRVDLPLLVLATGSFASAYPYVSWVCWVPNLVFAEWWLRHTTTGGKWRRAT